MAVSELGLGCARIGGIFQREASGFIDLLHAAHDFGINFFDTADMYCQGESEQLIGRAFQRRRDRIVIASKVGYVLPGQRKVIARVKPLVRPLIRALGIKRAQLPAAVSGALKQNFEPAYIRRAVEASLKRLRTDHLDLLQLHSAPVDVVVRGDWLDAVQRLKEAGKIRFYGISCDTIESAQAAVQAPGVSALQVVVSLLEQGMSNTIAPQAEARGIAIIARECLANGLLVKAEGAIDLKSYCHSPEQEASRRDALHGYRETAQRRGIALSKLALEYATGVAGVGVALVGASRMEQLHETLRDYAA
jgi:aryl-alcohol dehydrogenase-like predicted oxidoreductase